MCIGRLEDTKNFEDNFILNYYRTSPIPCQQKQFLQKMTYLYVLNKLTQQMFLILNCLTLKKMIYRQTFTRNFRDFQKMSPRVQPYKIT